MTLAPRSEIMIRLETWFVWDRHLPLAAICKLVPTHHHRRCPHHHRLRARAPPLVQFRMIVLANRPGFPFLGSDFYGSLGDVFGCHAVENPCMSAELEVSLWESRVRFEPPGSFDPLEPVNLEIYSAPGLRLRWTQPGPGGMRPSDAGKVRSFCRANHSPEAGPSIR